MNCKDCLHYELCNICNDFDERGCSIKYNRCEWEVCECFKEKSRFVELPYKVGDTVYLVDRTRDGIIGSIYHVVECSVEKIVLRYSTFQKRTIVEAHLEYEENDYFGCVVEKIVYDTSFGHMVFTNEQDAESAREKMEKEYLEEINRERDEMKNDV